MIIYLEKINFLSIIFLLKIYYKNKYNIKNIYYFNSNKFYFRFFKFVSFILKFDYTKFDIKENNNNFIKKEHVSSYLNTLCFKFKDLVEKRNDFKKYYLKENNFYMNRFFKKLVSSTYWRVKNNESQYTLYLLLNLSLLKKKNDETIIILNQRKWQLEYEKIFKISDFKIIFVNNFLLNFFNIYNYSFLLFFLIKINYYISYLFYFFKKNNLLNSGIVFNDDTFENNINKNHLNNDFIFQFDSQLKANLVGFTSLDRNFIKAMKKISFNYCPKPFLHASTAYHISRRLPLSTYFIKTLPYNNFYKKINPSIEKIDYNERLIKYYFIKNAWVNFFLKNNIKVYLSWYKFYADHIIINDAINEIKGIGCIWQRSYEAYNNVDTEITTDIFFTASKNQTKDNNLVINKINTEICVGLLSLYNLNEIKFKAQEIRKKIKANGAENIICLFDQNSTDEYEHDLLKESYQIMLEEVMRNPKLGLVLKPKKTKTLYRRLGKEITSMIKNSLETGRCYIFNESLEIQSSIPISLPALIGDVCIAANLRAGTSAIESASLNKRTLMLDREGFPNSHFYNYNFKDVIFNNWQDLILNLRMFFNSQNKNENFGNWSNQINHFDPYRDGQAQFRMGEYLNDLILNINSGINKADCIDIANNKFIKKWGKDKIIV